VLATQEASSNRKQSEESTEHVYLSPEKYKESLVQGVQHSGKDQLILVRGADLQREIGRYKTRRSTTKGCKDKVGDNAAGVSDTGIVEAETNLRNRERKVHRSVDLHTYDVKVHVKAAPEDRHHIVKQHHIRLRGGMDLNSTATAEYTCRRTSRFDGTWKYRVVRGGAGGGMDLATCGRSSLYRSALIQQQ